MQFESLRTIKFFCAMSSLQILSPEQRIQQLESNPMSVMSQVMDLDRQLRSSLAERTRELQSAREELGLEVAEVIETYETVTQHHDQRLIRLEHMVDDGDNLTYSDDSG
jgi:hypothetical protein